MLVVKSMVKKFGYLLLLSLLLGGCCRRTESDPTRPQVRGWGEHRESGITSAGEFLLTKGSSIEYPKENARVGIELKDVIQGRTCQGSESTGPQALLRFYRLPDKQTISELTVREGNTRLISFVPSLTKDYGLDTISLKAISTKEGWIWIDILK